MIVGFFILKDKYFPYRTASSKWGTKSAIASSQAALDLIPDSSFEQEKYTKCLAEFENRQLNK